MRYVLSAALLFLAAPAMAEPYVFAGLGTESTTTVGIGYRAGSIGAEVVFVQSEDSRLDKSAAGDPETSGFGLSAVVLLPVASAEVVGRLGVHRMTTESGPSLSKLVRAEATETVAGFGLGAQYSLTPALRLRGMFDYIDGKGEVERLRAFTVQAVYSF